MQRISCLVHSLTQRQFSLEVLFWTEELAINFSHKDHHYHSLYLIFMEEPLCAKCRGNANIVCFANSQNFSPDV